MVGGEDETDAELTEEISRDEVAVRPSEMGDPRAIVEKRIPADILTKYEVFSYRNAAVILSETRAEEFADIVDGLRAFTLSTAVIRTAGGNESDVPKAFTRSLRPRGWNETVIQGDLHVTLTWRESSGAGKKSSLHTRDVLRERFLDGHKIDYVKDRVAFDLEWNSKDQTFDRDLYAFSAFFQCGVIDAAVLVTRSASLTPVFKKLGAALKKDGTPELKKNGQPRMVVEKYGASTTWMGKLLYRLNAGRNGGCPVLAIGITPACISDWGTDDAA
jgi:hypothetical protein